MPLGIAGALLCKTWVPQGVRSSSYKNGCCSQHGRRRVRGQGQRGAQVGALTPSIRILMDSQGKGAIGGLLRKL